LPKFLIWLQPTVLLLTLLTFAACGDDDDDDSDAEATEDEANQEEDGDDVDEEELDEEVASQFEDILAGLDTVRVEYDVVVGETSGEVTLLADAGSLRLDFRTEEGSGNVIINQDASYFCAVELNDGEDACLEFPGGEDIGDLGIPFGEIFVDLITGADEGGIEISDTDDQEIVGVDADCFLVTSDDIDGEALVCLSDENGVPLLIQGEAEGDEFLLEAVEVSEDVSASDFEPPYPVDEFDLEDIDIDIDFEIDPDDPEDTTATADETAGE
jgi:hypothetical protein